MIGGIDLTKLTNDELYALYAQIQAELAKRQHASAVAVQRPAVYREPPPQIPIPDSTMTPPAKPFADVWCGAEARP